MHTQKVNGIASMLLPMSLLASPQAMANTYASYMRKSTKTSTYLKQPTIKPLEQTTINQAYGRKTQSRLSATELSTRPAKGAKLSLLRGSEHGYTGEEAHEKARKKTQNKKQDQRKTVSSAPPLTPQAKLTLSTANPIKSLIVIDEAVPNKHTFYRDLPHDAAVLSINSNESGIEQLKAHLANYKHLEALHLVSHANDGVIYLGDSQIDQQSLNHNQSLLTSLDESLKEGGDILFYGCDLAKTDKGEGLLQLISSQANVDVAASNNLTGNSKKGGDWELEIAVGDINATQPFSEAALKQFDYTLGLTDNSGYFLYFGNTNTPAFTYQTIATYDDVLGYGYDMKIRGNTQNPSGSEIGITYGYVEIDIYGFNNIDTVDFYFTNNEPFDVRSILMINGYDEADRSFTFVADTGHSQAITIAPGGGGTLLTLTGFDNITSFSIKRTDETPMGYLTVMGLEVANVGGGAVTPDTDGTLYTNQNYTNPTLFDSRVLAAPQAADLFEFTLSDGGSADGLPMEVTDIVVHVSGTSTDLSRDRITWRLKGSDADNVVGSYDATTDTLTFSGLNISVADGDTEDYTINAYYSSNAFLGEGTSYILSIDGDTDLTLSATGTQMGSTTPIDNGPGIVESIEATQLFFELEPVDFVSGEVTLAPPSVRAEDALGNLDTDFSEDITLITTNGLGSLEGNTASAVAGIAQFNNLAYTAANDGESLTLTAQAQNSQGVALVEIESSSIIADVVAKNLMFTINPTPLMMVAGVNTVLTQSPVVAAVDDNYQLDVDFSDAVTLRPDNGSINVLMSSIGDLDANPETVTASAINGVAFFSDLEITYLNSISSNDYFVLRANDAGANLFSLDSDQFTVQPISVITPPSVVSITRSGTPDQNASSVQFVITFDEDVNNLSTDDFSLTTLSGDATGTIASVSSSSGNDIEVSVNGITGTGTIRLDLSAQSNITDNLGNGNNSNGYVAAFSSGDSHNVDRAAPVITGVSIPDTPHKVGDTVTAIIDVASDTDDYSSANGGISGNIAGFALSNLSKLSDTQYSASFTISDGNSDIDASQNVPFSLQLSDSLANTSSVFSGAISQANDAIYANLPSITLSSTDAQLAEAGSAVISASITGSLNNQWPEAIDISLAYSGSATPDVDYSKQDSLSISSGSSSASFHLMALADTLYDATTAESITIDITAISPANITANQALNVTLVDAQSPPQLSLSVSHDTINEDGGSSNINASLTHPSFEDVSVNLSFSGSAVAGTHFSSQGSTLVIPAGMTNASSRVTAINDNSKTQDLNIVVDLSSVSGGGATTATPQQFTITISDDDNVAPVISSTPPALANEDTLYTYTLVASDGNNGDTLTLSAPTLPSWLSFNTSSGVLSGTPSNDEVGIHQVTLRVSDDLSHVDQDFSITVGNVNDAPIIDGTPLLYAIENIPYQFSATVSDVDSNSFTYSLSNQPAWMSISNTGVVSGTPSNSDIGISNNIVVSVSDGELSASLAPFSVVVDGDLDGDGTGDVLDDDIDGDGMPNDFEQSHNLDPRDPSDANTDTDNDGVNNLDEFTQSTNPQSDDYGPSFNGQALVTIDASGLVTPIPAGLMSATDALDGDVNVRHNLASELLAPGRHIIQWRAVDAAGNESEFEQHLHIRPLANWQLDQLSGEGNTVRVSLHLNGPAPVYPASVNLSVGGTASELDDHNATSTSLTINSGVSASLDIEISTDEVIEGPETIILTLESATNVAIGLNASHTITISEANHAPSLSLSASLADQPGESQTRFSTRDSMVYIDAIVSDPDPLDNHQIQWHSSNGLAGMANDTRYSFDPAVVGAGHYHIRAIATDDSDAAMSSTASLHIVVMADGEAPLSNNRDSDGDGIMDSVEGHGDSNGDSIPDYADGANMNNLMALYPTGGAPTAMPWVMETQASLKLALNTHSSATGRHSPLINDDDLRNQEANNTDPGYRYNSGLFDMMVSQIPMVSSMDSDSEIERSPYIVMAQLEPIPNNATYRTRINERWVEFEIDEHNTISSAPGIAGVCPPPGSTDYVPGLVAGSHCVQLAIEDGGPNDADNVANSVVSHTGGVTHRVTHVVSTGTGSGTSSPAMLLILLLLVMMRHHARLQKCSLALCLCALTMSARANELGSIYLSYALGFATSSASEQSVQTALDKTGAVNIDIVDVDTDRMSQSFGIGYQFNHTWQLELAYLDLQQVDVTIRSNLRVDNTEDFHPESGEGLSLSGLYLLPLGDKIQARLRLGVFNWRAEHIVPAGGNSIGTDKQSASDILLGLGLTTRLGEQSKLTAEYQYFDFARFASHHVRVGIDWHFY